jgi:hypothetical protein
MPQNGKKKKEKENGSFSLTNIGAIIQNKRSSSLLSDNKRNNNHKKFKR